MSDITPIGITNYRNTNQKFGIKDKDRLQGIYCIGKTGAGKSTLLKNMAISDIRRGNGLTVIDGHADVVTDLLRYIPEERKKDLIYFNATAENPIAFNPLYGINPKYRYLVASGLISTLKRLWLDSWGPRLEYILRYAILTLLEIPEATLLDIQPLLTDKEFRKKALLHVKPWHIHAFWQYEYDTYSPTMRAEAISPILNKTGLFLVSDPLRKIVGQKTSSFRLQQVLDGQKILLVNISKGEIGEDASTILGSMLVTAIQLAAMHRATQPEAERKPHYLFIDECQNYLSLAEILSECRKFGLGLFLAHQFIEQLSEPIRAAVFGNVGTIISFRVGARDAQYLAREFYPVFSEEDLIHLPKYSMYLKLMIDGTTSEPFSARTVQFLRKYHAPAANV